MDDDSAMHLDAAPTSSSHRKRTVRQRETESEDEEQQAPNVSDDGTPSKRLRDGRGAAVARRDRRPLKYRPQTLLNHLAFTQLYVTANFARYNPSSSPVVIVFVSEEEDRTFYRELSRCLPSLYHVAPSLQALAISTASLGMQGPGSPADARALPVKAICDLDEHIASDLDSFRLMLLDPRDALVVFDASGTCLWSSDELGANPASGQDLVASADVVDALLRVLEALSRNDDRMDVE